jgi:hypothetical protein
MTIESNDFQSRLRALLGLQGAVFTDQELSRVADYYPRCRGREHWDVRQYVGPTGMGVGAREYRVMRGSSVQDVFRSAERVRAAAVGTALNELESQITPGDGDQASARAMPSARARPSRDRYLV